MGAGDPRRRRKLLEYLDADGRVFPFRVVTVHHQDVAHAQRHRSQKVALQRDPVAIPAGHLQDRLDAVPDEEMCRDQAREVRFRHGAVGDVHRGCQPLQGEPAPDELLGIGGNRGSQFRGDGEQALAQASFELSDRAFGGFA